MTDTLTKKQRSYCMSRITRGGTAPETKFRQFLCKEKIRGYRIDHATILGRPDFYFPHQKLAVFIDGCFWHHCPRCFIRPKTNRSYWTPKIRKNAVRDRKIDAILEKHDITVFRIWEHELKEHPERCYNKFGKVYEKRSHV